MNFSLSVPFNVKKEGNTSYITIKKEDYKNEFALRLFPDISTAHSGEGYFVVPEQLSGALIYFNKDDPDYVNTCIPSMSFYGVKTPEKCFMVILEGMRYEALFEYKKEGDCFTACFILKLLDEHIEAYEDITLILHELPLDADYNLMAKLYRDYKYKNGLKSIKEKALPAVDYASVAPEIRVRMGWKPVPAEIEYQTEENEPEMHVAVTFKKLIELMEALKKRGVEKAQFCLVGWNKSGHDGRWPQAFPVEEKLGGEEGLRKAIRRAKELGYNIVAHTNSSDAYTIADIFSENMLIQDYDGTPQKGTTWSGGRLHKVCAKEAIKYAKELLPKIKALGFQGVHYIDVLSVIRPYYCHNALHPSNRKETSLLWKEMLNNSRQLFGGCASEGSYDMIADGIDFALYCGFNKFLKCTLKMSHTLIPLWELVYHGAVMACPSSELVNVGIIDKRLQLKFVEFGGRPAMYIHSRFVTESEDRGNWMGEDDLRLDTKENFDRTVDVLKKTVDFYEPLKRLQTQKILEHKYLTDDLVRVTYEDNTRIYVNYGKEAEIDNIKIPETDFVIFPPLTV